MNNIVYLNGSFIDKENAHIPITTHALHYGTGCFEGIRAYYNKAHDALYVFRMEDHYKRLFLSCKILFISLPHAINELCSITEDLVRKNFSQTDIYIRPLAYKADPAVGNFNLKSLRDGFLIYTVPLGKHLDTQNGIRANISSWRRISDNMIPPRAKISGSYVNTALAKTESVLYGYDEALFLDNKGHVVEGSAENIFIVRNNTLITPPCSDDILQGITRETVINLARDEFRITVVERSIGRSELYQADEILLVGTGAEISPVIEVDGRKIGNGEIGLISQKIQKLYFDLVHGENQKYNKYITKIVR